MRRSRNCRTAFDRLAGGENAIAAARRFRYPSRLKVLAGIVLVLYTGIL